MLITRYDLEKEGIEKEILRQIRLLVDSINSEVFETLELKFRISKIEMRYR